MKRLHLHVGVASLEQGIHFYSALFGEKPAKIKGDYAKWMLEDPRINFAISTRAKTGVDHLGLQMDENAELEALRQRVQQAELSTYDNGEVMCCYARSEKTWITDPAGVPWETFVTMEDVNLYASNEPEKGVCCNPEADDQQATSPDTTAACCG